MTTFRVQHNKHNPYAIVDKGFLDNPNLTAKAKGIFAYLLSKPDNWRVHLNHLVTVFQDGHTAIRSGLKELQAAGYLVRAAIRNEFGQIVEWIVNLHEAPHQPSYPQDKNKNFIVQQQAKISVVALDDNQDVWNSHTSHTASRTNSTNQPNRKITETPTMQAPLPDVDFPHLDHPQVGDRILINNDIQQLEEVNNISLGKEEIFELESQRICGSQVNFESKTQQTDSLVEPTDYLEEESTCPISNKVEITEQVKVINNTTKESSNFTFNNWIPDGAWKVDGKLDPNFVLWLAQDWQKAYGGDISKKKADVQRHFKKHPANIAISWSQYRDEQHQRYTNAALRMENGIQIKPDEQDSLLIHQRALTEDFPPDMRSIADIRVTSEQKINTKLLRDRTSTSPNLDQSNLTEPTQNNAEITNSSNLTENDPETSKSHKIDIDSKNANKVANKVKKWANGTFSLGKCKSTEREKPSELDELNAWLSDPILRAEVMPFVMNNDRYTLAFNEYGEPIKVIEIQGD